MGRGGLENTPLKSQEPGNGEGGGAESGATPTDSTPDRFSDPDLDRLAELWPALTPTVRAALLAMAEHARRPSG